MSYTKLTNRELEIMHILWKEPHLLPRQIFLRKSRRNLVYTAYKTPYNRYLLKMQLKLQLIQRF